MFYFSFDTLLITGTKSKAMKDTEEIHEEVISYNMMLKEPFFILYSLLTTILWKVKPGTCSIIKIDDVKDVMTEATDKLVDAIILFCQVI